MSEYEIVASDRTDLINKSELYEPMLYYGSKPRIQIEYVSDLHLLHHVRYYDGNLRKTVMVAAKTLYKSHTDFYGTSLRVFLGDISSDRDITVAFYKQYRMQDMYYQYKRFKHKLLTSDDIQAFKRNQIEYQKRKSILSKYISKKEAIIKQLKAEIDEHISYSKVIAPKGGSENIKKYLESKYYKRRNLPDFVAKKILQTASLEHGISELHQLLHMYEWSLNETNLPDTPTKLTDFQYKQFDILGFVILGNHEYAGFPDVDTAVTFYKKQLEPLGYRVLQNEFVKIDEVVLYGGSGFAKYSAQFNANNLLCCDAMEGNRAYEIEQTTLFEQGYRKAKHHAVQIGKCFICAAHYPVSSCLGKYDRETIYFTGHTHRNERIKNEDIVLYADNQVGYHNDGRFDGIIRFKRAFTDSVRNPYGDLEDGCYATTPDAYLQFYDYIGVCIGEGKLIRKRCEAGQLYAIKSRGFYGFFVVSNSGISIVNGGKTKKIALSKNIEWIYDNFNVVVDKYLAVLEPVRAIQLQISNELKRLGFDGTIHGLIVDVDFWNHVMVNPVDGSITFYYSPSFGQVKTFESFQKQLEFMGCVGLLESTTSEHKRDEIVLYNSNILVTAEQDNVLGELTTVSRRTGIYGISRAVSPLQRLFTGHVLRDFDLRLIEVADKSAKIRTRSLCGRVYMDRDENQYLVIHDDLGEFIRLLDIEGKETEITIQKLKSSMTGRPWARAYWQTKDAAQTIAEYGEELPDAWRSAIYDCFPRLLDDKT